MFFMYLCYYCCDKKEDNIYDFYCKVSFEYFVGFVKVNVDN